MGRAATAVKGKGADYVSRGFGTGVPALFKAISLCYRLRAAKVVFAAPSYNGTGIKLFYP